MKTPARMMKSQSGFSLIELMIVVAIIGILATIAVPNFQKFQNKAKQSEGKTYLSAIYVGEKAFFGEWSSYSSCMGKIGFDRDGTNPRYSAGFTAVHRVGPPGSPACAGDNQKGVDVTTANVTTSTTAAAFVAGAVANLTNVDAWTINQGRVMANPKSGL